LHATACRVGGATPGAQEARSKAQEEKNHPPADEAEQEGSQQLCQVA